MVRFLHTADWQLGMRAKMLGEAGELVRSTRIKTVVNLMKEAKKRGVDFIIVAGDVFESNAVDRDLIRRVADILRHDLPLMRFKGISEEDIHTLIIENPRRALSFV